MNNLEFAPRRRRQRALSINTYSEAQQNVMSNSLDNLENDLAHVHLAWHRVIAIDSNPLELALRFLDDTSVGLGHRYSDFKQLKNQIGSDLQEAVNEHYQAFNSDIASYSVAVDAITGAQNNISNLKESMHKANNNITVEKGSLQELNENMMKHTNMIEIFSSIEELIIIPDKVDDCIRNEKYREAQKLLEHGFILASNHSLWSIASLTSIKQQLELTEHNLFQNMIEEIHDIVYSKKSSDHLNNDLLKNIGASNDDFTSLENYIYNVVSVDIVQQSEKMNTKLETILKHIKQINLTQQSCTVFLEEGSEYDKLFNFLALICDLNRLPTALKILLDRAKKELHDIIITSSEQLHNTHPQLLNITNSVSFEGDYGVSMKNMIFVIMRKWFWQVFIKLLLSIQRHRVIYECVLALQPVTSNSVTYQFDQIWKKWIVELELLLNKYLNDPAIVNATNRTRRGTASSINAVNSRNASLQLFSLQDNTEGSSLAKDHTHELKNLLKDMIPGFAMPNNVDLSSVYIEEEAFEEEEALIKPSVFNMKMILEPLLLFIQATSEIIPSTMIESSLTSMDFFKKYMDSKFFPKIEMTINYLLESKVLSNNPYTFELNEENQNIFKSAIDFQNLFYNLLFVMHTSYTYRSKLCKSVISLLEKFQSYYDRIFNLLLNISTDGFNRKIIGAWLNDGILMTSEISFLKDKQSLASNESELMYSHCPKFYQKGKNLQKDDMLNSVDLDSVLHFLNSVLWILEWLPNLRKIIEVPGNDETNMNADKMRSQWSLFEDSKLSKGVKSSTLKLSMNKETAIRFDIIVNSLISLKYKLLATLRFDLRVRCIYNIGRLFEANSNWNPDVGSTELDQNIASLISDIRMFESKLKNNLPKELQDQIFTGIDTINIRGFIAGASSVRLINHNGIKKMSRNINFLQNVCRNVIGDSSKIDMTKALHFYSLCGSTEANFFNEIKTKELNYCTIYDLKNILRLIYGEELNKSMKVRTSMHAGDSTMGVNKRYNEAVKKLDTLKLKA